MRAEPMRAISSAARWAWIAVGSIGAFLVYFVTINHVDLYPWNNLRSSTAELPSTLVVGIPFLIYHEFTNISIRVGLLRSHHEPVAHHQ